MAEDTTVIDPAHPADHPSDFVQVAMKAMKAMKTDLAAPVEVEKTKEKDVKAPEKADKVESKSKIPDGVFETVKVDKKAEEKKHEPTSDFDKIEDPQFRDEKRKAQWDEVKAKGREFEKQAREEAQKRVDLETKIKDYEARGKDTEALNEKLAKLERENADAMALVRKVNAELDPEYQRKFGEGRNNLMGQAKTIVEESGGNPSDIETALNLKGKPRADALAVVAESLNSFQAGRLGRVMDALSELESEADKVRSNPDEYLKQREQDEANRSKLAQEEHAKMANTAFESAMSRAASESELFRVTDDTGWNEQGKTIKQQATEFWRNNRDPEKAARVMIDGFTAPVFRQLFLDQRKEAAAANAELESLRKELAGLYNRGPKISGATASRNTGPKDFADQAHGLMNGSIQQ